FSVLPTSECMTMTFLLHGLLALDLDEPRITDLGVSSQRRLVGADLVGERGDHALEIGIAGAPVGELRPLALEELEALPVEVVLELGLLLRGVLESFLVELEAVRVGLDADLDRPARLVGVDIVERGVRRRAGRDDAVDDAVGWRVVAALEARQIEER